MTVRFSWVVDRLFVPPDVPYRVFVHYLDEDGALAFVDDHELPIDVRRLQPGARIDYDRRVILPDRAMRLSIRVGLFSARFPYKGTVLDGKTGASDFPIVARFETHANPALAEEAVAGARGFDPWEIDGRTTARSSRWVERRGRFLFLQRAEGTTLLVQGFAMRSRLQRAPTLTLRVGGVETTRVLENDDRVVIQLDIPGDGRTRLMEGEIESDLTFNDRGRDVSFCVERFRGVPRPDAVKD